MSRDNRLYFQQNCDEPNYHVYKILDVLNNYHYLLARLMFSANLKIFTDFFLITLTGLEGTVRL